ncbi:NupC/NupG family nucleoside CNT transporter [Francisella frigiditurris]|uniref:Nucleoside permease nupC n=1 Tax=Francisella frigiditurris TaxID=1542390 RepID=A0A1J0KU68_9GAMM|nr:nucleoside transporter C-terminal domain-containing protein [Francisella frigiditurris]APC97180.1 nucleoside permease nupC [Francisella frigiditurris]
MFVKFMFFLLGIISVFILAFAWSSDRKGIKYKYLFIILLVQLGLAAFLLRSDIGVTIISKISEGFEHLLDCAHDGSEFIFGSLTDMNKNGFIFFFNVGMPIVLVSAIIGILQYFKILPLIIKGIGWVLSKVTGMGKLESFNAVSSLAVGQSENFINYKKIIGHLPSNVLYTMAATAMSTVSLAVAGAYMSLLEPKYVCVAMVMNMFGTFFVLTIINPYEKSEEISYDKLHEQFEEEKQDFFEMLAEYILDGFKVAIIVCAMLIGFIALLHLVDSIFSSIFGITFRDILGYIFYPFAWVLHINNNELLLAGKIMGTKMVTNEFVAMQMMSGHAKELTEHSTAVLSVFLVSFANFSSIGIIIGAIQALSKEASVKVAKFSLKILYGAVLVSFLSACVVGFVV